VEIIRFGVLIVLTIGLLSVAARAFDDDGGSRTTAAARPSTSAPSGSTSPGAQPTQAGEPSADPSVGGTSPSDDGSGGDTGSGGSGDGAIAAPELPRTGPDTALRLTGIALVLIAGGGLSLAGARRPA
jgi:hypothetical protein